MLSFALVPAGRFGAKGYIEPDGYSEHFYSEIRPISDDFEPAAIAVNGLDRDALVKSGPCPSGVMRKAADWVRSKCAGGEPVLVAYPLGFDWLWLYWYFMKYLGSCPFKHSRAFDLKTAVALSKGIPVTNAGRLRLPKELMPEQAHTHNAADDAISQAQIFAKLMSQIRDRND